LKRRRKERCEITRGCSLAVVFEPVNRTPKWSTVFTGGASIKQQGSVALAHRLSRIHLRPA
jgi:hypothetical protein